MQKKGSQKKQAYHQKKVLGEGSRKELSKEVTVLSRRVCRLRGLNGQGGRSGSREKNLKGAMTRKEEWGHRANKSTCREEPVSFRRGEMANS